MYINSSHSHGIKKIIYLSVQLFVGRFLDMDVNKQNQRIKNISFFLKYIDANYSTSLPEVEALVTKFNDEKCFFGFDTSVAKKLVTNF